MWLHYKFYTGLLSIKLCQAAYNLLSPYNQKLLYLRGTKKIISSKVRPTTSIPSSQTNLTSKNEFLLTLMRLHLGLLNEDLPDRF